MICSTLWNTPNMCVYINFVPRHGSGSFFLIHIQVPIHIYIFTIYTSHRCMCTVHTHTDVEHTHAHTHKHTLLRTDSTAWEMKSCQSPKSSTKGGGLNVPASRLLRTSTSIHRILYTWEIKNGWCKLQPSYKEPPCKLPSCTAAVPAVPHGAPSAEWTHQCCSG